MRGKIVATHKVLCLQNKLGYTSWPQCSTHHSFTLVSDTRGCFFALEFNSYLAVKCQSRNHYNCRIHHELDHTIEQHLGYDGLLPGAKSHYHSSSCQYSTTTKCTNHKYTGQQWFNRCQRSCDADASLKPATTEERFVIVPLKNMIKQSKIPGRPIYH